jgi:uncharacterized membrane protein
MFTILLSLHIVGGSAALLSMFVPMVTRKGGRVHRRAGWVFVAGMAVVSLTALLLAGWRVLFDPRPDARTAGLFLFYIAILTAAGVSTGVRVLRVNRSGRALRQTQPRSPHTDDAQRHASDVTQPSSAASPWDLGISSLLLATSLGMAAFGIANATPLFVAFSVVGLLSGGGQLAYWLRTPSHHMHWWFEHMSSMLGSCIAATTAFLVVNAGRLGGSPDSLLIWLGPTIIGSPAIAIWTVYYRRKFAIAPAARPGTSRSAPAADLCTPSRSA